MIVDLAGSGNELLYMNDPEGSNKQANIAFAEVVHQGWPYLFAVATCDISAGEELLISYGDAYCTGHQALRRSRLEMLHQTFDGIHTEIGSMLSSLPLVG